jgi:hypothetical protein
MITLSVIPIGNSVLAQIEATYPAGSDVDNVHCVIVLGGCGDVDIWRCCNLQELV